MTENEIKTFEELAEANREWAESFAAGFEAGSTLHKFAKAVSEWTPKFKENDKVTVKFRGKIREGVVLKLIGAAVAVRFSTSQATVTYKFHETAVRHLTK